MSHQEPERGNRQPEGTEPEEPFPMINPAAQASYDFENWDGSGDPPLKPAQASEECENVAVLEIAANHLRALKSCNAPIGVFIQKLMAARASEPQLQQPHLPNCPMGKHCNCPVGYGDNKPAGSEHKLAVAREIMKATQPFAQAWACEELEDRIKDFLASP